jgi:hypothetical protein
MTGPHSLVVIDHKESPAQREHRLCQVISNHWKNRGLGNVRVRVVRLNDAVLHENELFGCRSNLIGGKPPKVTP